MNRYKNRYSVEELLNAKSFAVCGVGGGIRTHGHWNHNPALYQLSYTHRMKGSPSV
jgi:hypothetical protein